MTPILISGATIAQAKKFPAIRLMFRLLGGMATFFRV
jgi:hypothetical protein